jgi:hypothetical protein
MQSWWFSLIGTGPHPHPAAQREHTSVGGRVGARAGAEQLEALPRLARIGRRVICLG